MTPFRRRSAGSSQFTFMAAARQTRVVTAAKSHIGEWKWSCAWFHESEQGTFLPGEWKCNLFVAEMLGEGGFKVPLFNQAGTCASFALNLCSGKTGRPPTASQWFNGEVSGTTLVGSGQQGLEKS
jgi:hypothetical protein